MSNMKVVCINNIDDNDDIEYNMIVGKTYEVSYIYPDGDYIIINDKGNQTWYHKEYFKTLTEYRNDTINKLLAK